MRTLAEHLIDDLAIFESTPSIEKNDQALLESMRHFILRHKEHAFSRSNVEGHVTGSALILDDDLSHVLLTHHKKLNRWLQLGGHWEDGDESPFHTAFREAMEESGGKNLIPILDGQLFDLDIHEIPQNSKETAHFHYDLRYLFATSQNQEFFSDDGAELRWFSLEGALELEDADDSLHKQIRKVLALKNTKILTASDCSLSSRDFKITHIQPVMREARVTGLL